MILAEIQVLKCTQFVMCDGDAVVPQDVIQLDLCLWSLSNSIPAYLTLFHRRPMIVTMKRKRKGDNACMLHSRVRPLASECCKLATVQVLSAPYRFSCALESSCARPSRCFAKLFIDHFCLVLSERLAISPKIEMQCRPMQR